MALVSILTFRGKGCVTMSIWFLIWLVLSGALLYFSFWTLYILMKQKKSWKSFSERHELRYTSGTFFESPSVSGVYNEYPVSLFTGEHQQEDARKNRKLTAIEIELTSIMPMAGAAASGGMIPLLDGLDHNTEYKPEHKKWKSEYLIRTDNLSMMAGYMSDERIAALTELMKVVNAWVMFIFMEKNTLLRLDMPNPLEDPKRMDVLLNKMVEVAAILELEKGEEKKLERLRDKNIEQENAAVVLEETTSDTALELELEEEEIALDRDEGEDLVESEEESTKEKPKNKSDSKPSPKS